jgi:hypothetical protein
MPCTSRVACRLDGLASCYATNAPLLARPLLRKAVAAGYACADAWGSVCRADFTGGDTTAALCYCLAGWKHSDLTLRHQPGAAGSSSFLSLHARAIETTWIIRWRLL